MQGSLVKKGLVIVILLLFIVIGVEPSSGLIEIYNDITEKRGTLYVGGSGLGNYSKIQDAIDNASAGDTVFVYNESSPYYEHLNVHKSIVLEGEDQNTTIIDGSKIGHVIKITTSGVTVNNFTIQNSGQDIHNSLCDSGIFLQSDNNKIFNNHIKSNKDGITTYWDDTISKYNEIRNNLIFSNEENGIELMRSAYNNISENEIFSNKGHGIYLNLAAVSNNIDSNVISENNDVGISVWNSNHNQISYNILQKNPIVLTSSQNNIINDNEIFNSSINIEYDSYNNIIINNTVNGKLLMYLYNEKNKIIDIPVGQVILVHCDNITVENQEGQIDLIGSSYCNLTNNKCSIVLKSSTVYKSSSFNSITNNIIANYSIGISNIGYSNNYNVITRNLFQNNNIAIQIRCSRKTTVAENTFKENNVGLDINENGLNGGSKPYDNIIRRNNFIFNGKDIVFQVDFFNLFSNKCMNNYWGKDLKFIKMIPGKLIYCSSGSYRVIKMKWWFVDWQPARGPYDI